MLSIGMWCDCLYSCMYGYVCTCVCVGGFDCECLCVYVGGWVGVGVGEHWPKVEERAV